MFFNKKNDGLPADDVTALAATPKAVWIGTSGHGIAKYSRGINLWAKFGLNEGLKLSQNSTITSFDVWGDQPFATWYNDENNGYVRDRPAGIEQFVYNRCYDSVGDLVSLRDIYIAVGEISRENAGEHERKTRRRCG